MLARDGSLWCNPTKVSQQAVSQRFLTFPSAVFEKVFKDLLPSLRTAWHSRNKRLLPESIQFTLSKNALVVRASSPAINQGRARCPSHKSKS